MLETTKTDITTLRYRDIVELAAMRFLIETMPALSAKGIVPTTKLMQKFRDEWTTADGQKIGEIDRKILGSDFLRLMQSTGVTDFGKVSQAAKLQDGINDVWKATVAEYDNAAAMGNFLHPMTDPLLRNEILVNTDATINKAVLLHKGKSIRELVPSETVRLYDSKNPNALLVTSIAGTVDTRRGFAAADVVAPTQESQTETPADVNNVIAAAEEEFDADEKLLGWHGGTVKEDGDVREYRGLSHIMGAYLTKADALMISKSIDANELFDASIAHNGAELLKHMRSSGYDFSVKESTKRNQLEVVMTSGERVSVRVFDPEQGGKFVGRVYDAYNEYYLNIRSKEKQAFQSSDSIAILDFVMGKRKGKVTKTLNGPGSRVQLQGLSGVKSLQIRPVDERYASLVYGSREEALLYIGTALNEVSNMVNEDFDVNALQDAIDAALDGDAAYTSPEVQTSFDDLYSVDPTIREAQEKAVAMGLHSVDGGTEYLRTVRDDIVGNYDDGFNVSYVVEKMKATGRKHERDAMMAALKTVEYDLSKIKGNDFSVNAMRERLVAFDPETAKGINEVEHPMLKSALKTVQDTLRVGNFKGDENGKGEPSILIDENGVLRWEAYRETGSKQKGLQWQKVSGDIGQIMVPDENGIIKTKFQGENNYGIVPGYTGYFAFDGDYDNRMNRFRVKGFEQNLTEQLSATLVHQMTRPIEKELENIVTTLDASALNGLYHGDVYGKRVELDFLETSQLSADTKQAILQTLSNRVRFDNQYSDYATTSAETTANREMANGMPDSEFSYWKSAGETNMRVLAEDLANYADLTMTGTGKTQGLIWFLTDGAKVNPDGSVKPSEGILDKDGNRVPDTTALQKLPYFDKKSYNAWDRNQMSSNQLMTGLRVDENVNTALMSFGGWTFDDSYAVSKEFAERNQVFGTTPNEHAMDVLDMTIKKLAVDPSQDPAILLKGSGMIWSRETLDKGVALHQEWSDTKGSGRMAIGQKMEAFLEENGRFRPLQRGDKLSDFGGNKGTIGIVIDRDMSPSDAKAANLEKEVAFMKANPKLDVISAPYSMLSRHNAGVVRELMDGDVQDLVDPETGATIKGAMGQLNIIVTDMVVDNKTHAYTRDDVLEGKGRKASGQLAWALQSKDAKGIMDEIYGRNDASWSTFREYLIATGLDMKPDGSILPQYTPHEGEERNVFKFDPEIDETGFLRTIHDQGGFLETPFELSFKNGATTNHVPVLSASLRQNLELIDGSMRLSDFTNDYANMYKEIAAYEATDDVKEKEEAKAKAQAKFDNIQSTIIDRQFNGGHNGKHSFIRDKIMGKRMQNSATGVAVVDPRLDIGQAGMNEDMMSALNAKEGDWVMMFRDPVWRDGAIRAVQVVKDDSVHGVAFNPIADKSHDGDFDGDTYGLIKFDSKAAINDLVNKFSHAANMIDHGPGKDELYFQSGMDLASAEAKAEAQGDTQLRALYERAHKNALSDNPKLQKSALRDLSKYSKTAFNTYGFASDYVSLDSDQSVMESFKKMVDNGAKGSPKKLEDYRKYHDGEKTDKDARAIQYASGVKSDDTGLAGAFSQKLVSIMRNQDITAALEAMYPLTQGTLQIKHDAEHAKVVNEILTEDMNRLFRGRDVKNPKEKLTPKGFKSQLTDIMENKMGVDVNEKFIDAVTDVMTHKGQIVPLTDAMKLKGSPMDRVAYGGGYEELKRLSVKQESLLTGEQNKAFAPFSMRNADEKTKIAKRDTQKPVEKTPTPVAEADMQEVVSFDSGVEEDAGLVL